MIVVLFLFFGCWKTFCFQKCLSIKPLTYIMKNIVSLGIAAIGLLLTGCAGPVAPGGPVVINPGPLPYAYRPVSRPLPAPQRRPVVRPLYPGSNNGPGAFQPGFNAKPGAPGNPGGTGMPAPGGFVNNRR